MVKSFRIEKIVLIIVLVAGTFFRFYHYSAFSLSNDELSAIHRLNFSTFGEMIQKGVRPDGHPAGAQILLWFWTAIFGFSPLVIRFPFVLISSLAPLFGFLFVRKIFGFTPALFTTAALAFSAFPILYGQIARPYGIGLTFVLLAAWLWAKVLFNSQTNITKKFLLASALAISWDLCLYTHYFAALNAVIIGISGLFFLNKSNWKYYIGAAVVTILLFLPHLNITLHQISLGGVGQWLESPSYLWPVHHLFYIFNDSYLVVASLVILIPITAILGSKSFSHDLKFRTLFFVWFLLPLMVGFFYSRLVNPVLQNSILIFSMPFLWILIFSFVPSAFTKFNRIIFLIFCIILILDTFIISPYYQKQHFGEFQKTAKLLGQWQKEYKDKNIMNLAEVNDLSYLKFYNNKLIIASQHHFKNQNDLVTLKIILDSAKAQVIAFADPQNIANPLVLNMIEAKYPYLAFYQNFSNKASVYLFEKSKIKENYGKTIFIKKVDSLTISKEFCYTETFDLKNIKQDSLEILVRVKVITPTDKSKAHWVVTFQNDKGETTAWFSSPFHWFGEGTVVFHRKLAIPSGSIRLMTYCWNPDKELIKFSSVEIMIK